MSGESEQVLLFLSWRLAEQEAPCTIGEMIIATLTTNVIDNVDDDADAGHVDDWSSWKPHAHRWDGDDHYNEEPHALFCLFVLISANNYERHHLSLFFNQNHQEPPCRARGLFSPKSYKNAGHFCFSLCNLIFDTKIYFELFYSLSRGNPTAQSSSMSEGKDLRLKKQKNISFSKKCLNQIWAHNHPQKHLISKRKVGIRFEVIINPKHT